MVLIGISLFVALGFLFAFLWAVKSGQYQDTYTPSVRMLFDDEEKIKIDNTNQSSGKQDTIHTKEKT